MKFAFAPETSPLPGYTIKRAIDRGGFGEVYFALTSSGKEVALKLLQRNQQIELRGVTQCLNLKHPNLVTIFDIKTDDEGDHWVVMEYVSGKSLEQVLEDFPKGMPLPEVEGWLAGIAAGVGFLHDRGIVHRDLKPANVFRENGVVKIGDVGLSKFITPSRRSAQTESVGTVYYMAPEVARGKYGSELDVYSLGVMLYEMITGQVPFNGESTGEILMKHLTEAPDLLKIPAALRPVLAGALEKDPRKRTPSAGKVLDDFRRALAGKPVPQPIPDTHFASAARQQDPQAQRIDRHAQTTGYAAGEQKRQPVFPARSQAEPGFWRRFGDDMRKNPVLMVAVIIGLLYLTPVFTFGAGNVGGSFTRSAPGFVFWAALGYVSYWVGTRYLGVQRGAPTMNPPAAPTAPAAPFVPLAPAAQAPVVQVPVGPVPIPPAPVVQPVKGAARPVAGRITPPNYGPLTPRAVALQHRLGDLTGALSASAIWSVLLTALIALVTRQVGPAHAAAGLMETPASLALFAFTTLLGSWLVIIPSKLWEGNPVDLGGRRVVMAALGAALGASAYWLERWLMVGLPFDSAVRPLISNVAGFSLASDNGKLNEAAFVVFFAALFAMRRWWWHSDSFRPRRLRVFSLLLTALLAWALPCFFKFNQVWGVCWAVAISAAVQLSSAWVPPAERAALAGGAVGAHRVS
jgi:hypothetical protein